MKPEIQEEQFWRKKGAFVEDLQIFVFLYLNGLKAAAKCLLIQSN